jgi:hypothetical protein
VGNGLKVRGGAVCCIVAVMACCGASQSNVRTADESRTFEHALVWVYGNEVGPEVRDSDLTAPRELLAARESLV